MPPSPSLKGSFRGDPRGDSHKRVRSLESAISLKEKDDDLALFNEMQSGETDTFLLESTDGFEDLICSKLRPYSEFKLEFDISAQVESSDLLNEDGDKNDYEWLLTPPDTPLFPSLDDEPAPVSLVHNGRARSRLISLSRSSTMEKSNRSSRGSLSPQRSSLSPRSRNSTFRGRPSSAHSNPASYHSSNSPSRRPSPPPVKPSTPPPRSLTPTFRRKTASSPVRTSRGNSESPKVKAWQSNIPGFSLESPPNLRTSLADRPASFIRGSSPTSRTSRDSFSNLGRQSMSPTPRSISSSHSQERDRDRLSSHSKGSIASSGDEDVDSFQSFPASVERKGVSGYPNGRRSLAFSKKSTKTISPSSAPKRSFDSAMRQMDQMTPQNMFRPLVTNVPSSTRYFGTTSSAHRTLNATPDLATSTTHVAEGSVLSHDNDLASDCARATFSNTHDEVFVYDNMDAGLGNTGPDTHDALFEVRLGEPDQGYVVTSNPGDSKESGYCDHSLIVTQCDIHGNTLICSICGVHYCPDDLSENRNNNNNICLECKRKELLGSYASLNILETSQSSSDPLTDKSEESRVIQPMEGPLEVLQHGSQSRQICPENTPSLSMEVESMGAISKQEVTIKHRSVNGPSPTCNSSDVVSKGTGISVLFKRSSSAKGPIAHGRTINRSAISFEDLSYARDLTNSMRSSTSLSHDTFSASSSVDLMSIRLGEMFSKRQWSGKLSESSSKPQSTVSSFSGNSVPVCQAFGLSTSSHDGSFEGSRNASLLVPGVPITGGNDYGDGSMSQASIGISEIRVLHEIGEDRHNVRESNFNESSLTEGTTSDNRVDQVDIDEEIPRCSFITMTEIEINDSHPSSPRSQIDVVVREDLDDSSTAMHSYKDVKNVSQKSAESDHADRIVEKSTMTLHNLGGRRTRSITLEEATDTILFCSSIIQDLAYKAASIAIEKEKEKLEPLQGSRPTVTIPDKSNSHKKDSCRFTAGKTPKTQKARKRRTTETEVKPSLTENENGPIEPIVRNVGLLKNANSMQPPKVESNCNCTIM